MTQKVGLSESRFSNYIFKPDFGAWPNFAEPKDICCA
jgi:hypothetical protein